MHDHTNRLDGQDERDQGDQKKRATFTCTVDLQQKSKFSGEMTVSNRHYWNK